MGSGLISFTFDDGVRSTFEYAAPVLARHSMPATVGVICDHLLWHPNAKGDAAGNRAGACRGGMGDRLA